MFGFRAVAIALAVWLALLPATLPRGALTLAVATLLCVSIGALWSRRLQRRSTEGLPSWPRRVEFTRDGKYFVGITVGVGLAAINTGNNLLYLVLGLLLSLIIASGVLSEMSLQRLKVERRPPLYLYAGRPCLMGIALTNAKTRLPSFSIEVEDLLGSEPIDKRCYFLKVPAGRTQHTSYRYTFTRRGRYRYDGFRVATKFPFALFRKSRVVQAPGEVVVFPEVSPLSAATAPTTVGGFGGASGRTGRNGDFYGLRAFRSDDDSRDIHWRASARRGELLVREREQASARRVLLVFDNASTDTATPATAESVRSSTASNAFEKLVAVTASLAVHYLERGYLVGLATRGTLIAPGNGALHRVRLMTQLALIEPMSPSRGNLPLGACPADERVLVNRYASSVGAPLAKPGSPMVVEPSEAGLDLSVAAAPLSSPGIVVNGETLSRYTQAPGLPPRVDAPSAEDAGNPPTLPPPPGR